MTSRTAQKRVNEEHRPAGSVRPRKRASARRNRRRGWLLAAVVLVVVLVVGSLYGVYRAGNGGGASATGQYPFTVGQPGVNATAPAFNLASTTGGSETLSALRGKTVLLYFQEGLSCQPCFDQLADLERNATQVRAAGISQVVSITTDPIDLLTQKTHDMKLSTPVLSDPELTVSQAYRANQYGMMGNSRDGHSFVLVGPNGTITWRADYGGSPKYTMFVPTANLLADLHAGTKR